MSIPVLGKEQVLEMLSSDNATSQLYGVRYAIFSMLHDADVASSVGGIVGSSSVSDYDVSLGEWAEIYLDLAGLRGYSGDNPYVIEMIEKLRLETRHARSPER